jgi:hypothetical protein
MVRGDRVVVFLDRHKGDGVQGITGCAGKFHDGYCRP